MARASGGRKLLRWFLLLCAGAIVLVLLVVLMFRFVNPPTSAFMVGYQLQGANKSLAHEWVPMGEISPWMPLAVVASEDQRFPHHVGVDFEAVRQALSEYRAGDGLRGASTITQQTAKNLFLWNGRSFIRKARRAAKAEEPEAETAEEKSEEPKSDA